MKGFTFDLQRFATTWLLKSNGDGTTLTLTEEGDESNSKTWTSTHAANSEKFSFKDVIPTGDTVKLAEDITLEKVQFVLYKDVTLDLNGKTLKATGDSPTNLITVSRNTACNFTITDTSDDGNGALVKETSGTSITSVVDASGATATITLERGNVINSSSEKSCGVKIYNASSSFTMTGGSIKTLSEGVDTRALDATGGSTCTINISGGTIESGNDGLRIKSKGTVNISGGNFSVNNLVKQTSTGNTFNITGGVFNQSNEDLGISTEVTIDGTTKYCVSLDSLGDGYITATIDNATQYFSSNDALAAAVVGKTPVTIDGQTKYFTDAQKAQTLLDSAITATIDNATQYFSSNDALAAAIVGKTEIEIDDTTKYYTDAQAAQAVLDAAVTASVDDKTKYYSSDETLAAAVENYTPVSIDGTTKYYTTQELADAAVDGKIAVIIDDATKYYTTQTLADAAVNGKTEIEIDGTTKYFTDAQQAQNLLANAVTATVDGTTKYFTSNETLSAAVENYFAVTVGGKTSYYTTEELAAAARAEAIESSEAAIGDEYFSTFAAAVSAAKAGDTITVLKNITLDETLAVDKNLTLDLGGKTFTSTADTAIQVSGGNFTLQGTGKLNAANIAIDLSDAAATATIDGGTVKGKLVSSASGRANVGFTLNGGTFDGSIKPGATLLVDDKNVLVAEGWNQTAAKTFDYIVAPESGYVGTKILSVSGVTSTDQIKFDATQKLFTVPTTATVSTAPEGYKVIKLAYDNTFSTATVKTDKDAIEITENLLADTVTKISASGNTNTIYISGGDKVTSIVGGKNNDTLAGTGDKLTLTGGAGNDIFVYETGNAVITDYAAGADKISVKAVPTRFEFKGSNLVLTSDDGTLTLNGAKGKTITFTDGENDTERTFVDGGAVNDGEKVTLDQNFKGSTYNISKAKDVTEIDASTATKNINLVGNNLGNTIRGGSGNDTLTGGVTAADEYTGNAGADVFVYNGGADKITDYKSTDGDTIKLAKNFTVKSAAFGDDDAVFTFNVKGNTMTLSDAANDTITVKDASNKVWTYTKDYTANANGVTLNSSATGFDASGSTTLVTLDGSAASAVKLTGNKKNNVFVGTKGADTFVYTAGSDVITNYDSTDKVQVDDFGSITAAKFGTKTVLTVSKGAITFNNAPKEINLVDADNQTAALTKDGIVTDDGIQLLNGTKIYGGTASTVDATNVKNALTLSGGAAAQTFTGAAGKTVYTFDGAGTMTIENYVAGDKISVKGSVTNFAVNGQDVTLNVDNTGSIVLKGAANKTITLHDDNDKAGKYTARAYPATGILTDKAVPTAVTLASSVTEYEVPSTVKQITYTGGNVTLKNFDTTKGKINHGKLAITDVTSDKLTFGTGNTLTLDEHDAAKKVQLTYTNAAGKAVSSTVWLGDHALYDNTVAKATKVSVTSGDDNGEFTAGEKIKSVTALGSEQISIAGNKLNNTLTANGAGDTLDGGTGTDVLIGGNGADVFIHDKITGTTTINNYTSTDSIKLGDGLEVVGSAYSAGAKNGTLTLTVEGTNDAGKSSTSKIVVKSNDFTKTGGTIYGTVTIDDAETSFGKNAIYDGNKVKLLPTFSGKFTATESSKVDGSAATKALTLHGSKDSDLLTGGAGKDVFVYASGDGDDVIADFTYNDDKLKVSSKGIINKISVDQGDLKFDMKDGGSVTLDNLEGDFVIKANKTLYWFDDDKLVTASDKATKKTLSAIIKAPTDYAIVELDYGTNLVSAKLATASDQSTTFNASTFKKTT